MSGIKVNPDCITEFNDFKVRCLAIFLFYSSLTFLSLFQMGKSNAKYLVFAITADLKEINIERKGADGESWDAMTHSLPADSPRYVVCHYHWDMGVDGKRSKLVFMHWSPPNSPLKMKMIYAATKPSFKQTLTGLQVDVQADSIAELSSERVQEQCQRFNKQ